jgi:hypothetical protein
LTESPHGITIVAGRRARPQAGRADQGVKMSKKPAKIDLWTEHKDVYSPSAKAPQLVKVPPLAYLAVDGEGDPSTAPAFREAIGALYGLAYTMKFAFKKESGLDFRVMPLSGLYHTDDPGAFPANLKEGWKWTLMMPVPTVVSAAAVKKAKAELMRRKGSVPALDLVQRRVVKEGLSAQIMHIGPYSAEGPTIERLHAFIREKGYTFAGSHHEIYLSDPNRTAPQRMKTIVRHPVKKPAR